MKSFIATTSEINNPELIAIELCSKVTNNFTFDRNSMLAQYK